MKITNFIGWGFWGALAYILVLVISQSGDKSSYAFIHATILARIANSTVNFFIYKYYVYKRNSISIKQILFYIGLVLLLVGINTAVLLWWDYATIRKSQLWAIGIMILPQAFLSRFYLKKWVFNWQPKSKQ